MNSHDMFKQGEIVLVDFPFTDLTKSKLRPAIVLQDLQTTGAVQIRCLLPAIILRDLAEITASNDVILCAVSSRLSTQTGTTITIMEGTKEFRQTNLKKSSVIHVSKIFTFDRRMIKRRLGMLPNEIINRIFEELINIFRPTQM